MAAKKAPFGALLKKMGNKLSCSCGPLKIKGYRFDSANEPWSQQTTVGLNRKRGDGPLLSIPICRLWAEVFHVTTSSSGTVKWTQVSEDLVPVNITCLQEYPEIVFHITAYNSQVEKILDVKLTQPGTRIGQASECFVYWKDTVTNDTWGLNFTSPIDAKQFRECCDGSRLHSRLQHHRSSGKHSSRSTPASPSKSREPQCTCMTAEQYAKLRSQTDLRMRAATPTPTAPASHISGSRTSAASTSASASATSTSNSKRKQASQSTPSSPSRGKKVRCTCMTPEQFAQLHKARQPQAYPKGSQTLPRGGDVVRGVGSVDDSDDHHRGADSTRSHLPPAGRRGDKNRRTFSAGEQHEPPYHDAPEASEAARNRCGRTGHRQTSRGRLVTASGRRGQGNCRGRSKSTDHLDRADVVSRNRPDRLDSGALKKMLEPVSAGGQAAHTLPDSPSTSPERSGRRRAEHHQRLRAGGGNNDGRRGKGDGRPRVCAGQMRHHHTSSDTGFLSEPECGTRLRLSMADSGMSKGLDDSCGSPPSDSGGLFDSRCFATTPSSSNGNSDVEGEHDRDLVLQGPASPTSQLLMDYEEHLRHALEKGLDAESYSLRTFEALLSRSMENLEHDLHGLGAGFNPQTSYLKRKANRSGTAASDSCGRDAFLCRYLDRDGCRTMPSMSCASTSRNEPNHNKRASFMEAAPTGRCFNERPRSVNAQYDSHLRSARGSGRAPGGVASASTSFDRSGYVSDKSDSGRRLGTANGTIRGRRASGSAFSGSMITAPPDALHWCSDQTADGNGSLGAAVAAGLSRTKNNRGDSIRPGYLAESGVPLAAAHQAATSSSATGAEGFHGQDSRHCYLTSSEISDDDHMSLTTALSDEEDVESARTSPYKMRSCVSGHNGLGAGNGNGNGGSAASFNCTGAVRKAGFLSVKKWLLRKKHQVELARKRGWKGYWVCLKGTTLLFYPCDSEEGRSVEATPKHLIIVDGAIMQAIPEHPKRDFIFCLSTAFGDAYLFQSPCQVELENWINSIHSACAAAFARHRGKTGTLHLLQEEIYRIEKGIESDQKLKHMAELQLSVVSDPSSKLQIEGQIRQWEENLERLHCEQFRLRCYMASLQNGELPNPKGVLTQVTPTTKAILNRLGLFTVSSFHAYVCARSPSLLSNLLAGRGATKRRTPAQFSRTNSAISRRSINCGNSTNGRASPDHPDQACSRTDRIVTVSIPDNQVASFYLRDAMTVEEFMTAACAKKGLNPVEHFVRIKKRRDMPPSKYFVPHRSDLIETYLQTHEVVEVCAKILYQVELRRGNLDTMWGFSVEAELVENTEKQDELCCYVSRVEERSVAMNSGIIKGDEIMVINGAIVSDLDMMFIESVLQEELSLCMMMRSARTEPPELTSMGKSTDDIIESLVCPPPPSDNALNDDIISSLIVPAPGKDAIVSPDGDSTTAPPSQASEQSDINRRRKQANGSGSPVSMIEKAVADSMHGIHSTAVNANGGIGGRIIGNQPALDVDAFLRRSHSDEARRGPSPTESLDSTNSNPLIRERGLTDSDKLRKVILELVETEQTYVENLARLMETYFQPLSESMFFANPDISGLFGNIKDIFRFQQQFLRTLEGALEGEAQFDSLDCPKQFKNVLFSIGSAFLYYVNHFKLYSSFCASHSKAQKALHSSTKSEENQALQEFLQSCNRRQEHSTTLESYLIQPIQRILKYPLLLQQLKSLTAPSSDEHQHLVEALIGMERVAEHINEMQRIHEEYGAIFDHLFRQHQKMIDLSPGDLLYYGGVEWLNISDFLGKIKKGLELHAMCFVFKTAVVFLCKERLRQKKKSLMGPTKQHAAEVEIIRYQVLIPVTEVQVRASTIKDVDSHYLWELIHLKSQIQRRNEKTYHLSNSTSEFRNAFLKTIRQIIRESVRNMSLPGQESLKRHEMPKNSLRSRSVDIHQLKLNSTEVDIHSETDSARECSSGLRSDGDESGVTSGKKTSYLSFSVPPMGPKAAATASGPPSVVTITTTTSTAPVNSSASSGVAAGSGNNSGNKVRKSHGACGSSGIQLTPSAYHSANESDLGSPVWKPRDDSSVGNDLAATSTSAASASSAAADKIFSHT